MQQHNFGNIRHLQAVLRPPNGVVWNACAWGVACQFAFEFPYVTLRNHPLWQPGLMFRSQSIARQLIVNTGSNF